MTNISMRPDLRIVDSKAPTIMDVADAAGVSKSTASRALTDAPNVRAATRARVVTIAEGLGYVPNEAARALAARRTVVVARAAEREAV
jgi:DNA-binding LacI/PurR family transcriptional regulator